MAIVDVDVTDLLPFPQQWAVDPAAAQQRSPIPRGLITFSGIDEVAAKGAGDETNYNLKLTMPIGFAYLPKRGHCMFRADDLTESWESTGIGQYNRTSLGVALGAGNVSVTNFQMLSAGQSVVVAEFARRVWVPGRGAPKLMMRNVDTFDVFLQDMSAGATSAGDMEYQWEFYVFDNDQVDKWQVNTPIPVIDHASF